MSNRIIKDFKGWKLLTEGTDIVTPSSVFTDFTQINSPLNTKTTPLNFSYPIPTVPPPANITSATTSATTLAPATPVAKVKAAPPIPTTDLKTAKAEALTPSDWAAIQTKLNQLVQLTESRSVTRLYESLVADGIAGPLTMAAVADFVTKYNETSAGKAAPLPTTPPTATTIDQEVLNAIAAVVTPAAAATSADTVSAAPAATGSVFGPSANITGADFAVTVTKDTRGYDQKSYPEPTKLLLATAKSFKSAAAGPGTSKDLLVSNIKVCKTSSDFYKLNAVLSNVGSGDIVFIINDELGNDDLTTVTEISTYLTSINVESSFAKAIPSMNYENTPATDFKEGSFSIKIPKGLEPATVFPQDVYAEAVKISREKTGSPDILL